MSYLDKGRKQDLIILANELGIDIPESGNLTKVQLKKLFLNSEEYDEELTKSTLESIIDDRLEKIKDEKAEKERQRLEVEKKMEMEMEMKKMEAEQQRMKMENDRLQLEAEQQRMKMENDRLQLEAETTRLRTEAGRKDADQNFELEKLRLMNQKPIMLTELELLLPVPKEII